MASIQDYEGFEIKITPEYTNWWSYHIEFFYKGKPLFNPEIFKTGEDIKADEYSSWALLPMLEKAIECNTPDEKFGWGEWEDEASIVVQYKKMNKMADDGFFIFETFVSSWFFNDGSSNTMDNPAGLRLMMIERDTLKKFYRELNDEMLPIYKKLPEDQKNFRKARPNSPKRKQRSKWKIPPQTPPFPFATSEFKNK